MRSERSLTAACRANAPRKLPALLPPLLPLPLPHPPRTVRAPALGNGHPGDAPLVTGHPLSPRCQPFRNEDTRPASILYFIFAPRVESRSQRRSRPGGPGWPAACPALAFRPRLAAKGPGPETARAEGREPPAGHARGHAPGRAAWSRRPGSLSLGRGPREGCRLGRCCSRRPACGHSM